MQAFWRIMLPNVKIGIATVAIKDVDVKAEIQVFDILKEAFPMEVNVIAWNQLEAEDLTTYNALIVGSRFSEKTINGLSACGPKITQAVRENGLGFLSSSRSRMATSIPILSISRRNTAGKI
ncbi:MAG: hypothetical protein RBT80_10300 [Candidatus Vecturithrix sp.]|nr:hypothetical protein [Candidatus Vecturithrix sp.]